MCRKDGDMQEGILDVHRSQKVFQIEGSNDWPGRFHAEMYYPEEVFKNFRYSMGQMPLFGLEHKQHVWMKILKPFSFWDNGYTL